MSASTAQLLAPQTIRKAISQIDLPGTSLQNLFGWGLGGTNVVRQAGRHFSYDIFNLTRSVATARVPGQASNRTKAQKVGTVAATFPRSAETIELLDEHLLNQRAIGGRDSALDRGGEAFLSRQEAYLAQRFANLIEFQTAAMLRGSYAYDTEGDELRHGFYGGDVTVDFRIPAGNLSQLDMLGAGNILAADWATPTTDIPAHLHAINAAMIQLTGMGLAHVVLTTAGWQHVVNNEVVQAQGGSGLVWESLRRTAPGEFTAVLRAAPWITFHVIDYGLEIWNGTSESFTKLIEDDHAAFLPEPSPRWVQYLEGSEIVTEGPGGTKAERFGFHAFAYPVHDPSGWDLCAVMNGIPALYTPQAVAYGLLTGGSY
ncbi:MAG: major capsid protein [Pirellulaceae bacterium]|nr:major capsid protein [Pirellulaceae bacterium]